MHDTFAHPVIHNLPSSGSALSVAQNILNARRKRGRVFPELAFGDPAWDMILDLYVAAVTGRPVCPSSIGFAAAVPQTTVLRLVNQLAERGLVIRQADRNDRRRVLLTLSEDMLNRVDDYLASLRSSSVD
jgi:DNA-binding MarR family transcriptional regulator